MRHLRVHFVLPGYFAGPNGGFRIVFEYANYLAARGHEVSISFPASSSGVDPLPRWAGLALGATRGVVRRVKNRPLISWFDLHPSIALRLPAAVEDSFVPDADVVVATAWSTADAVVRLSPRKGRKYYLIQGYETWAGRHEDVDETWRLPMKKVVISNWLMETGRRLGAKDMRHIPNGLDLDRFRIIVDPAERPLSVLSLYHHSEVKGVPYALEALAKFHQAFPDAPVTMFGAVPWEGEKPGWISYHERPSQEELVRTLYNGHAIYLAASVSEGWALPPAEAMACGCLFIGTRIGGFADYAVHPETALLARPRDPDGLFENLKRAAEDPNLLRRLQEAGTALIRQFTWERAGAAFEEYLLEA